MTLGFDDGELKLYFGHVVALLLPTHNVNLLDTYKTGTDPVEPGDVTLWTDDQVELLAQEGRRQLDNLTTDFERIRERGKYVFTTALALIVGSAGLTPRITGRGVGFFALWFVGLIFLVVGFLGAASVFVVTAELGTIDAVLLSRMHPNEDFARSLAAAYARAVRRTGNSRNNRFTVLRDSAWFTIVGSLIELGVWLAISWP